MSYRGTTKIQIPIDRVFNKAFSDRKLRDALRPIISNPEFKRSFGLAVVDHIVERTESGKDKNNTSFKPYSEEYKKSLIFRVYGKSNNVNLRLTGEMLSSLNSKNNRGANITIEFSNEKSAAKADGHISGRATGKVRDFFGISDDEMVPILKEEIKRFRNGSLESLANTGIPTLPQIIFGFGNDT